MNRNKLIVVLIYSLIVFFTSISFAQSDYETVQKFKRECAQIEQQLKDANSADEISTIPQNIDQLRSNFSRYSDLIDKALYPENYESSIQKLNDLLIKRNGEFASAKEFNEKVSVLKQRVDTLSLMNNNLEAKLDNLETLVSESNKENSRLSNLIADLKTALHKRDVLVMNMVDSLMPPVMRQKPMLSSEDKEHIKSDINKDNILANVKSTIRDNIKYLNLTSLQPSDIDDLQNQQEEFSNTWSRIGPSLVEVYSDDKTRTKELVQIDSLITAWKVTVKEEAWQSIKEEFAEKGVDLVNFSNGEEFTNSVKQYILKEEKRTEALPEEEAKQSFVLFVDSTWKAEIEPKWTPFLKENGLLAENDHQTIEKNIEIWRSELYPSYWWVWFIVFGIVLAGLALLFSKLKKRTDYSDIREE